MTFMLKSFHFTHKKMHTAQCEVQQTGKQLRPPAVGLRKLLSHIILKWAAGQSEDIWQNKRHKRQVYSVSFAAILFFNSLI